MLWLGLRRRLRRGGLYHGQVQRGAERVTPRETMDLRQRWTPSRGPLPPQRWGILPTEEFWSLAALTPISFVFWLAALFFYDWLVSFGLPWWQNGLGCMVFAAVWAGLMERWSRKFFNFK